MLVVATHCPMHNKPFRSHWRRQTSCSPACHDALGVLQAGWQAQVAATTAEPQFWGHRIGQRLHVHDPERRTCCSHAPAGNPGVWAVPQDAG